MASNGIRDRVAIVGMGCTKFAEHWDKSTSDLLVDATKEATASAGVGMRYPTTTRDGSRRRRATRRPSSSSAATRLPPAAPRRRTSTTATCSSRRSPSRRGS